jgi:hypothetical protein
MNFFKNLILINTFVLLVSLFNGCSTKNDTINTPRKQSSYIQDKNLTMAEDICKQNDIHSEADVVCSSEKAKNIKQDSPVYTTAKLLILVMRITVGIALFVGNFF